MLDFERARVSSADASEDEDVNMVELASELMPAMEIANSAKGLKLSVDFSGIPSHVHTRHRALRAILLNLALNAIKFTTQGSVSIIARHRGRTAADETIEFEVKDTGPGIGTAQLARAFEPWTQLSASTTRLHRGLGLGLAVVKRNVGAVGGALTVDSAPDKGSRFTVTIPCAPATNGTARHSTPMFRAPAQPQLSAPDLPLRQIARPRAPRSHP
jgi:signal transduction histidine kinase